MTDKDLKSECSTCKHWKRMHHEFGVCQLQRARFGPDAGLVRRSNLCFGHELADSCKETTDEQAGSTDCK